jgi:hypothetical protein
MTSTVRLVAEVEARKRLIVDQVHTGEKGASHPSQRWLLTSVDESEKQFEKLVLPRDASER